MQGPGSGFAGSTNKSCLQGASSPGGGEVRVKSHVQKHKKGRKGFQSEGIAAGKARRCGHSG